jgi:hypothetical protein
VTGTAEYHDNNLKKKPNLVKSIWGFSIFVGRECCGEIRGE